MDSLHSTPTPTLPKSLLNAIILIMTSVFVNLFVGLKDSYDHLLTPDLIKIMVIGNVLSILIFSALCYAIARGKRWARFIVMILLLAWLIPNGLFLMHHTFVLDNTHGLAQTLQLVLKTISLILLYTPTSTAWFYLIRANAIALGEQETAPSGVSTQEQTNPSDHNQKP